MLYQKIEQHDSPDETMVEISFDYGEILGYVFVGAEVARWVPYRDLPENKFLPKEHLDRALRLVKQYKGVKNMLIGV